ncbi:hypothetical protein COCOBI_12-5090 [Coccomyxa sp. Obi]|nr:hypothetical protein COCOBI_12-5090 [Coccomyxa sp. Obi]
MSRESNPFFVRLQRDIETLNSSSIAAKIDLEKQPCKLLCRLPGDNEAKKDSRHLKIHKFAGSWLAQGTMTEPVYVLEVGNLPPWVRGTCGNEDYARWHIIKQFTDSHKKPEKVELKGYGNSLYAHVTFTSHQHALEAVKMDGKVMLKDYKLTVQWARVSSNEVTSEESRSTKTSARVHPVPAGQRAFPAPAHASKPANYAQPEAHKGVPAASQKAATSNQPLQSSDHDSWHGKKPFGATFAAAGSSRPPGPVKPTAGDKSSCVLECNVSGVEKEGVEKGRLEKLFGFHDPVKETYIFENTAQSVAKIFFVYQDNASAMRALNAMKIRNCKRLYKGIVQRDLRLSPLTAIRIYTNLGEPAEHHDGGVAKTHEESESTSKAATPNSKTEAKPVEPDAQPPQKPFMTPAEKENGRLVIMLLALRRGAKAARQQFEEAKEKNQSLHQGQSANANPSFPGTAREPNAVKNAADFGENDENKVRGNNIQ